MTKKKPDVPIQQVSRLLAPSGGPWSRGMSRAEIAGYLGKSDAFDKALVEFAFRYADQNDADYAAFKQAVAEGRLEARADDQIKVPAESRTMTASTNGKPIRPRR